jgi:hypothetical protein
MVACRDITHVEITTLSRRANRMRASLDGFDASPLKFQEVVAHCLELFR